MFVIVSIYIAIYNIKYKYMLNVNKIMYIEQKYEDAISFDLHCNYISSLIFFSEN